MASPFGCNRKNLFQKKTISSSPAEPVTLIADKSQVITAVIPFGTKHAGTIRAHMHENIKTDDHQKIFIYRSMNGWTNISLESTETSPKLTCDPITTLINAWTQFNACPQVGKLVIQWKGESAELGYDDIANMEGKFDPLPEETMAQADDQAGGSKTDAEIMMDMIETNTKSLTTLSESVTALDTKLGHAIGIIEKLAKLAQSDDVADDETVTPATSNRAGKRRANAK